MQVAMCGIVLVSLGNKAKESLWEAVVWHKAVVACQQISQGRFQVS